MEQTIYGAYGRNVLTDTRRRTAYVGEVREVDTGWYALGERIYDPTMRRLLNPDKASPFEAGGINRYAYCSGDPIGRIDPGGNSWFAWLVSTLDRIDLPVTTARSPSGDQSAFVTPTLRATAMSRPESAELWSAIRRNAPAGELMEGLRAYGNARVPLSGSGSQQTHLFSVAQRTPGIQWPRKGNTAAATVVTPDKRTIQVVSGPLAFSNDPRRASRAARGVVYPHWIERTNASGGVQFAATTTVNLSYMHSLKNYIDTAYPSRPVTMFAGAHGVQAKPFWDDRGKRMHLEQQFFNSVEKKVGELKWAVKLVNYADVNSDQVRERMKHGRGVDIQFTCFGATDLMFMEAFNIFDMTSRSLDPVSLPDAPLP